VFPALRTVAKLVGVDGRLGVKSMLFAQDPTLFVDPARETLFDLLGHSLEVLASAECAGFAVCVAALFGIIRAVRSGDRPSEALGVAVVGMLVVLTVANRQHASPRHLLVLLPGLVVISGRWLESFWYSRRFEGRRGAGTGVAAALLVSAMALAVPSPGGLPVAVTSRILETPSHRILTRRLALDGDPHRKGRDGLELQRGHPASVLRESLRMGARV
jgi:hypothetical protein